MTRAFVLVAGLILGSAALAGEGAPRSLPYDPGVSGALQRMRIKGKKVVSTSESSDGTRRVRTDRYAPQKGRLALITTAVEGTHANGTKFSNTHFYGAGRARTDVIDTLKDVDDMLDGGSLVRPSMWTRVKGAARFFRTLLLKSDSSVQKTTFAGGKTSVDIKMRLEDGRIHMTPDHRLVVESEEFGKAEYRR